METYDKVVSLGYVCNVPELLSKLNLRTEALPFDRVATPMWAVLELLSNEFQDFLSPENITSGELFEDKPIPFVYDQRYYTRLLANTKVLNNAAYENLIQKMHRREKRLLKILEDGGKILFVRSEEPILHPRLGKRKIFPEYSTKYDKNERYYLTQLSKLFKERYPELDFKILFLNHEGEFNDTEHNIVGIPVGPSDYHGLHVQNKMKSHVDNHKDFINANL